MKHQVMSDHMGADGELHDEKLWRFRWKQELGFDLSRGDLMRRVDEQGFCGACEGVYLVGSSPRATAHHTVPDLKVSAEMGCALCGLFYHCAIDHFGELQHHTKTSKIRSTLHFQKRVEGLSRVVRLVYKIHEISMTFEIFEGPKPLDRTGDYFRYIAETLGQRVAPITPKSGGGSGNLALVVKDSAASHDDLDDWKYWTHYGHIASSPRSESCIKLANHWLSDCVKYDEKCRRRQHAICPTRLVKIYDSEIKLVDMGVVDEKPQYATLTYCWGQTPFLKSTSANVDEHRKGIPLSAVPNTFRDAIWVAQKLGISYIWIDAMCIIQDSVSDWRTECSRMADYYGASLITISPLNTKEAVDGFLADRQLDIIAPLHPRAEDNVWVRRHRPEWSEVVSDAVLNTRGWTLQERVLATRVLHFTKKELLWECDSGSSREGGWSDDSISDQQFWDESKGSGGGPKLIEGKEHSSFKRLLLECYTSDGQGARRPGIFMEWYRLIFYFTRRELTVYSDRLPAVEGLANMLGTIGAGRYSFGLFIEDLPGLCWSGRRLKRNSLRVPTWSWASVDGPVSFPHWQYGNDSWGKNPRFLRMETHHLARTDVLVLEAWTKSIKWINNNAVYGPDGCRVGKSTQGTDEAFPGSDELLTAAAARDYDQLKAVGVCQCHTWAVQSHTAENYRPPLQRWKRKSSKSSQAQTCKCGEEDPSYAEKTVYFLIVGRRKGEDTFERIGLGYTSGNTYCQIEAMRKVFVGAELETIKLR